MPENQLQVVNVSKKIQVTIGLLKKDSGELSLACSHVYKDRYSELGGNIGFHWT